MRAVTKTAPEPGATYVTDHAERACGPGEVRVEVAAASVCGTDRELVEYTDSAKAFGLDFPVVLGHECAGTVVEVGDGVQRLRVGDRVALESHVPCDRCFCCRTDDAHNCANLTILGMHLDGAFAERLVVPERICYAVPEAMELETAALLEPAGVAMHALQRAAQVTADQNLPGQVALVSGCGPVGLVLTRLLLLQGADVVVVEPNPYRRGLAEQSGARVLTPDDDAVAVGRDLTGDRGGFDVAFEASGFGPALTTLLDAVRREATVVTVGHPGRPVEVDVAAHVNKKGLTLRGVFGRRIWSTWEALAPLVAAGRLDLAALVTHRLPLDRFEEAVDLLSGEACKVLLVPGEA